MRWNLVFFLFAVLCFDICFMNILKNNKIKKFGAAQFRPGSTCNLFLRSLTIAEKQTIVNLHNKYRNQLATGTTSVGSSLPYASNMLKMYWNDQIAAKAQSWANNCKFQHSTQTYRTLSAYTVGENLYESMSSLNYQTIDWTRAINSWWNEIKDYEGNVAKFQSTSGPMVGHFTQVAWANSYQIGCGFAQFYDGEWYTNYYVCEYGPLGNVISLPVYNASSIKKCNCPTGTSCAHPLYKNLCCPTGKCSNLLFSGNISGTVPRLKFSMSHGQTCYSYGYQ
jgi:hypothetical protein